MPSICSSCPSSRLWTVDELVSPIAARMECHFSKWLNQPKYIFALVYRVTRDFLELDDVLQPLIDRARIVGCSAREAWVSAMVKSISSYLSKHIFSRLAEKYYDMHENLEVNSSWLNLVDLIISFDKKMLELASPGTQFITGESAGISGFSRGISVLSIFCHHLDWLEIWAEIEMKDAEEKLELELQDSQVWLVDIKPEINYNHERGFESFLLSSRRDYKAPLIIDSVLHITWALVERCRNLSDINLRAKFIKSTAIRLLHEFFDILIQHSEGIYSATPCEYHDPLLRTSISINGACYCKYILQEWSENLDFLEMVTIADKTVGFIEEDPDFRGCFFRDEIRTLTVLESELLEDVLSMLLREFDLLSCCYIKNRERWERDDTSVDTHFRVEDLPVSADLVDALNDLIEKLLLLKKSINSKDFLDLWRGIASGLDYFMFSSIPLSGVRFSTQGFSQFRSDMLALISVFQSLCIRPEAFFPYISDTLKLLQISGDDARQLQEVLLKGKEMIGRLDIYHLHQISPAQAYKILRNRRFRT